MSNATKILTKLSIDITLCNSAKQSAKKLMCRRRDFIRDKNSVLISDVV